MIFFNTNKEASAYGTDDCIDSIEDEVWARHCTNPPGTSWDIIDDKFTDLSTSDDYRKIIRGAEINAELETIKTTYEALINTPLEYTNGHTYLISWAADSYANLILAGQIAPSMFPISIYDSTYIDTNKVEMTLIELIQLSSFLTTAQQVAYNQYSTRRSALKQELEELQGT
jgi:hypothetical protein